MSQPIVVVCAPADSPIQVRGTVFGRYCSRCNDEVMIAPSGQRVLRENPDRTTIICFPCLVRDGDLKSIAEIYPNHAEVLEEMKNVEPNLRRERN